MFWCDEIADRITGGEQTINDSKTPSGRVHVGSLRGVLIHDAIYRALRQRHIPCRYLFGVDDYDPLDEIPEGQAELFGPHLGAPLCNVPPPPGSTASDLAEHYIQEFFTVFGELGVTTEKYRMRDIYRSGRFNESIHRILSHSDVVRRIYRDVSKSERPDNWYPFQVICEKCCKIGTTMVTAYDGKEVQYTCKPKLVQWATGCGYEGKMSPFDGRGKLPWKLEWVAKWHVFPVTIEGAGKDHSTKGGSRDVAAACLHAIFDEQPPLSIPYEFFLVDGAKMSSSKGIGATARDMADFLPPEIMRFLMLRSPPNRPVNFAPTEKHIIKVFNDYDRCHTRFHHDETTTAEDKRIYEISQVDTCNDTYEANFQLVVALAQMPHLDVAEQIEKHKGSALTDRDRQHLDKRIAAARYWIDHFATEEEKTRLQEQLPASAQRFTASQRAFLHNAADRLEKTKWQDEALQSALFEAARVTPISQSLAFQTIYGALLDRDSGPKAGNLIAALEPTFVIGRFRELPYSHADLVVETAISRDEFEVWLTKEQPRIREITATTETVQRPTENVEQTVGIVQFLIRTDDDKAQVRRVLLTPKAEGGEVTEGDVTKALEQYIQEVGLKFSLSIAVVRSIG